MNIFQYFSQIKVLENPKFIIPILVWIIIWKGLALWRASQRKEALWFWLLMCINTFGVLEICYIFVFSNPKPFLKDLKNKFLKKTKKEDDDTNEIK